VISFLVDHNFNEHIVDGLIRRDASLNFTLARSVGLSAVQDPALLAWAAARGLIVLSHDGKTIPAFAYARVTAGQPMPGIFLVDDRMPIGLAVDELLIAAHCLTPRECENIVLYFPL